MEDLVFADFGYPPTNNCSLPQDLLDEDYIDPDSLIRQELERWEFSTDEMAVSDQYFVEEPCSSNDEVIKVPHVEVKYDTPDTDQNANNIVKIEGAQSRPDELLLACDTGTSDFTQLLDKATSFFRTVFKVEESDSDDPPEPTPSTSPHEQPLIFEKVTVKNNEDSEYESEVKIVKVDPSSPINDPFMILPASSVEESPELLENPKRSFYEQLSQEVSPELANLLKASFPNEQHIELIVDEGMNSSELALSSPIASYRGTLDPCDFQGFGIEEDKCLPKIELPFLDGPSYEPMIILHPKFSKNSQAACSSSARTNVVILKNAPSNRKLESTWPNFSEENQENQPVESGSRVTKNKKQLQNASRTKKTLLQEQENDARFLQRQEVVEAKNLRPRKMKTESLSIDSMIWKTPKPKRKVTKRNSILKTTGDTPKRKRGRPRLLKNLPSSTPLAVKVENFDALDEPESAELSPLVVSPIKLIRRLPTSYRSGEVEDGSSTLSANSPASSWEGVSYNRTPTQSAVVLPYIKTEPATLWFNPKSSYIAKPAVLVVDMKADRSLDDRQRSKIKTEPATVVFSRKSSEPTTSNAISCKDSPYYMETETFPPHFENPIRTANENLLCSIKIEDTPVRRANMEEASSDRTDASLKRGHWYIQNPHRRHTNTEPSTIYQTIKKEPLTLVADPKTTLPESSRKHRVKPGIKNFIPNPKNHRNLKNAATVEGLNSSSGIRPVRKRMRYAKEEYECQICAYKCTVESALHKHVSSHLDHTYLGPKYSCDICGLDTNSESESALHMVYDHKVGAEFRCDCCLFQTGQLKKLVQHRRKHSLERPHTCSMCDYRSTRRDNLHSHARRIHHIPRMEGDTFTQPDINWDDIIKQMAYDNNNHLSQSFE